MSNDSNTTQSIQRWLDEAATGNAEAREQLLGRACDRLMKLTRKLIRGFPQVHRWEETDDVFQNAILRLCRALDDASPRDARHFFRLSAMQIRRELIDLSRRYQGPQGMGVHHATQPFRQNADASHEPLPHEAVEASADPQRIAEWTELHQQIEQLPDEQREVFDLLWYQGLSQEEAAEVLSTSVRTIKRRWRTAKLAVHEFLKVDCDES